MRSRIDIVFALLFVAWIGLIVRAFTLQVLPNENLTRLRGRLFETVVRLEPRRGNIVDRNGRELATTVAAYSLFADPKVIESPKNLARQLSKLLDIPSKEIFEKISAPNRRFAWIDRRLSREKKDLIESLKIPGLGFVEEGKRVYPYENLLGQTLGFVGREGTGLEGLESRFEKELRGEEKQLNVRRDARGRPLIVDGQVFTEKPGGLSLQLTIDFDLQYFLEQELLRARQEHLAARAVGIILDPQTSEILAMASDPGFNPNRPTSLDASTRRNGLISDVFEPGSTLKTFTIAAALREDIIKPNSKYYCEKGRFKVGDKWIREASEKEKWEWMTVSQILEVSSNIGVTKIAFDLGQEKLRKAYLDFGLGDKTGIDLPGETRGILPPLPWRLHHFSNISFGQGIAVSPLQLANAYAAIANGGILRQPRLLKSFINPETQEVLPASPQKEKRVMSEQVARQMQIMLMGATSTFGTGTKANVPGYIVAGKTGTAQKVNPNSQGYMPGSYISSFAGFVPANQPKFVIYIAVDSSQKGYYGADVAAPVFNRVAEYALRMKGVLPNHVSDRDILRATSEKAAITQPVVALDRVPELRGLTLREVLERFRGQEIKLNLKGKGVVVNTIPASGETFIAPTQQGATSSVDEKSKAEKTLLIQFAPSSLQ